MTKEVMKLALEALRMPCEFWNKTQFIKVTEAIKALEEALKQDQDEPVAWLVGNNKWVYFDLTRAKFEAQILSNEIQPLYTKPQQRKPLTDEEIWEVVEDCEDNRLAFARAIESAHGIKE
jgi:hypothetical protein